MRNEIEVLDQGSTAEIAPTAEDIHAGQWYWVTSSCSYDGAVEGLKEGGQYVWFACVMDVGSNYVELHAPHGSGGYRTIRVHADDFWSTLRREPNPEGVIAERIAEYESRAAQLFGKIQDVTAALGLRPAGANGGPTAITGQSNALVTMSNQPDIKLYERSLVEAKDKTLPALYKGVEDANAGLAMWMSAGMMPLKAKMKHMKEAIGDIDDRIFNISLYAGLTEEVIQCCPGHPAGMEDKLHVMQRMHYMDEEALIGYEAGGMEFKNLAQFDQWISRPDNRDRILPFNRTMVAMRVRRNEKARNWDGRALSLFVPIGVKDADTMTYLYIRNGEQVWRLSCDMDYGELIFPDKALYSADEPMMFKMFAGRFDKMMSKDTFDDLSTKYAVIAEKSKQWQADNPDESWIRNPHKSGLSDDVRIDGQYFNPRDWMPFDHSSVYFDEAMAEIEARIKHFNRVALIIQGLFDRSEVLSPHPPVQSWNPAGFNRAITLVYDGSNVIQNGEAPDFEAYRSKCNASIEVGSVVVGQEDYWMRLEAEKWNNHASRSERDGHKVTYRPRGNPRPGAHCRSCRTEGSNKEGRVPLAA